MRQYPASIRVCMVGPLKIGIFLSLGEATGMVPLWEDKLVVMIHVSHGLQPHQKHKAGGHC